MSYWTAKRWRLRSLRRLASIWDPDLSPSLDRPGRHSTGDRLRFIQGCKGVKLLLCFFFLSQLLQCARQLVMRRWVRGLEFGRTTQCGNCPLRIPLQKQRFAQIVKCIGISWVKLRGLL